MAYIDKIAKQERTGSNITGINVDAGISNMISPKSVSAVPIRSAGTMTTFQLDILDGIEKFALEVDRAKTENAKIKLGLDLENARLDLEEKWATVHDRYTNTDTWNSYLEDKKKLLSEQAKIISSMKYMTLDEKKLTLEKNNIAYRENYAKSLSIRTDAVAKQEVDNARGNLEQILTITSNLDIHDDKKAQENYKTMGNQIDILKKFAGLSDEQALVMYGNYMAKSEIGIQTNYLEKVIMNESLSFEKREEELNELKAKIENKELMRAYAEEMAGYFITDDKEQAVEYLYTKLTDESSKVVNTMSNQFKRVKREKQEAERARIRAEREIQRARQREEQERIKILNNNFNIAYNSGSYNTMENAITAKTTKGVRYDDRIKGEIEALNGGNLSNSRIYHITGKSIQEINAKNEYIKDYVPNEVLSNMSVDIENLKREGKSETEAMLEVASAYSGNNPEMTNLVMNSLTQDGGYTKSIDIAIKANKGDVTANQKLKVIGSLEKTRGLAPKLDNSEMTEITNSDEAEAVIQKLVDNGADRYTAKKAVAEYVLGSNIENYQARTGNQEVNPDILYTGDINRKDKKKTKEKLKKMVNQDIVLESFSDSIKPRKRMKSTKLEGDLQI